MDRIKALVEEMSLDDLCGQLLCYEVSPDMDEERMARFEKTVKETKPGGIFFNFGTGEQIKKVASLINKHTKVPVIVSGDAEHGPTPVSDCPHRLPNPMAWGACDDEELVEIAGVATAQLCRKNGIHWSFAPLVDLNYGNIDPGLGTRSVSDSPSQVVKIAGAYLRGLQKEGLMAGGCKHFPGPAWDDRNAHFCSVINGMTRDEWMKSYGYIYREMFKYNPASVMIGHVSLPAFQEDEYDESIGYKPATISHKLLTKLLKEELGFEGCIVSDALCMVGIAAYIPEERIPVEFIKAGGDMALFAEPSYFNYIKDAVLGGTISMERLKDAVIRILKLKESVGLLDGIEPEVKITEDIEKIATKIAEKSIKIVRNKKNILPVNLKKGDHVLICNLLYNESENSFCLSMEYVAKELNNRGIETTVLTNPWHKDIKKVLEEKETACILINSRLYEDDSTGSSMRFTWKNAGVFWRGYVLRHPKVVFTSFGDPYKLYEVPFLDTYVNAFSAEKESQKAFVKVLLGEIEAKGKNPVGLKGFFEREVFPNEKE